MIEQRAEVNVHGQFHITPLMWAAGRGHVAIVRLLLENGAKVNAGDKVCISVNNIFYDGLAKFIFA